MEEIQNSYIRIKIIDSIIMLVRYIPRAFDNAKIYQRSTAPEDEIEGKIYFNRWCGIVGTIGCIIVLCGAFVVPQNYRAMIISVGAVIYLAAWGIFISWWHKEYSY